MTNEGLARVFTDIGNLFEIKGANAFKIRAYRNAADLVGHMAERIAELTGRGSCSTSQGSARTWPAKIRELVDHRRTRLLRRAAARGFPVSTLLDMLRSAGCWDQRRWRWLYARTRYRRRLDELEAAARCGPPAHACKGHRRPKKEAAAAPSPSARPPDDGSGRHLIERETHADGHRDWHQAICRSTRGR